MAAEPQGILTPLTPAAIFLTLTIEPGAEDAVRELLSDVSSLRRAVGFRIPEAGLSCVAGIGASVWDRLFGPPRPAELHPFRELVGWSGGDWSGPTGLGRARTLVRARL